MTRTVIWLEPLGSGKYGKIVCSASSEEIIAYMKNEYQERHKEHPNYPYKNEQDALDDFMAIHWATYEDISDI